MKRLFDADGPAVYAATGHLLFIREGKLLAQDFDPDRLELTGDPFPIAENVTGGNDTVRIGRGAHRVSHAARRQRPAAVRVDRSVRSGNRKGGLSRYGRTGSVAVTRWPPHRRVPVANGNMDIWSYETGRARGTGSRLMRATTFTRSGRQTARSIVFGSPAWRHESLPEAPERPAGK